MLRIDTSPNPSATAAARPAILITLAAGVAIGAALASPPVRGAEPSRREAAAERSNAARSDEAVRIRLVRVIPLPTRETDAVNGARPAR